MVSTSGSIVWHWPISKWMLLFTLTSSQERNEWKPWSNRESTSTYWIVRHASRVAQNTRKHCMWPRWRHRWHRLCRMRSASIRTWIADETTDWISPKNQAIEQSTTRFSQLHTHLHDILLVRRIPTKRQRRIPNGLIQFESRMRRNRWIAKLWKALPQLIDHHHCANQQHH